MLTSPFEGLERRTLSPKAAAGVPATTSRSVRADGSAGEGCGMGTGQTRVSAGVAQLVERQPSKLNVASSSLVSRSLFISRGRPNPRGEMISRGRPNPRGEMISRGRPNPRLGFAVRGRKGSRTAESVCGVPPRSPAHLAQLVEHVLGKDEVISSILMVGSHSAGCGHAGCGQSGCGVTPLKLRTSCAGGDALSGSRGQVS
jgi:hypothetical protein